MELRPVGKNILVRKVKRESVTAGGIHMPDTAKDTNRNPIVRIIAMSEGAQKELPQIEVGDQVLTGKWHCERVDIDGEDYGIIQPEGVLGKVVR